MNILHIEAGKHLYGGAKQVVYLLEQLKQLGVSSSLICPQGSDIATAAAPYAEVFPLPLGGDADIGQLWRIRRIIKQNHFDLVHLHSRRGADTWGALAAKSCGLPVVCSRRVDNPEPRWLSKLKYHGYQHTIAISEGIRQVLLSQGVSPDKVTTVRSAVDVNAYQPTPDANWFYSEFALNQTDIVLGNFAQMIERKGQALLIEAVSQLLPEFPTLKLLLFGKGPKLAAYQQQVAEAGLQDTVQFPGFREDVARILPNLYLVAHPAYTEGLGVALLQAAACAVPIVATKAGGIPEAVRDQQNGLLIEPGNLKQLVTALRQLITQPQLARQMGQAGYTLMHREFSITTMAKGNLQVYRQVLNCR